MATPDISAWLANERAVHERIVEARSAPGASWLLHETCPSARQQYFLLRHAGSEWVGRRCAGASRVAHGIVTASQLLGDTFAFAFGERDTYLDVQMRPAQQAAAFLEHAADDPLAEIHFPFPSLDRHGREWVCPPHYWQAASEHAATLAEDERHLRHACTALLGAHLPARALVHDPACSTGDFLAAMARACPSLRFSGSDIAPAMVDTARSRHARLGIPFTCADAASLPAGAFDGLLLRFLNAEVVRRSHAIMLFRRLACCVRPGGLVVMFGHSPVLVPVAAEATRLGWDVLGRVAATADGRGLFQCYALRLPLS